MLGLKMWNQIDTIINHGGEIQSMECPRCGADDITIESTDFVYCGTCGYTDEPNDDVVVAL